MNAQILFIMLCWLFQFIVLSIVHAKEKKRLLDIIDKQQEMIKDKQ